MPSKSSKSRFREFRQRFRAGDVGLDPAHDQPRQAVDSSVRRSYIRQYVGWLWPFRRAIIGVFLLAVIAALLSLIPPLATQYVVDHVLNGSKDRRHLMIFGVATLAVILLQQGVFSLRQWTTATLNGRVLVRLRRRLYGHLLHLPLTDLSNMKSGGIVSRLSGDMDQVSGMLQIAVITPGVALIKVIATVGVLFWISWKMALVATFLIPPLTLLNLLYIRRVRPIYRTMRRDRTDIDGRVAETFSGIRVVRAFARERGEMRDFSVAHHAVLRKNLFAKSYELVVSLGWGLLIPLISLIVIWYGGLRLLAGEISIGGIMAFQMYILMLLQPISVIVDSYGETQQALAAMERVFDLLRRTLDKPDAPDAVDVAALPQIEPTNGDGDGEARIGYRVTGVEDRQNVLGPRPADTGLSPHGSALTRHSLVRSIEFDDVHFAYRPDHPVLNGISLRVEAGQSIALVGPSGSGKTTITNLVARFYDPTQGAIRLNSVDLRKIRLRSYRRLLAYVPQDVFLFDGTVAENIAFARRHAPRERIIDAARRANADDFIQRLPEGYDTLVGERGLKLSGGQAQRVSIARAFLADPQILILDEATSNLDTESEELIQAGMMELIANRTTFMIAHRLSTVMHADLIVVVENGRITETGMHTDLMARGERYREMVERQMRSQKHEAAGWLCG